MRPRGELAIVLHTHMPYVEGGGHWPPPEGDPRDWPNLEGFGTWPFGEEWLWEAIATSYLPLLEVLDRAAEEHPLDETGRAPVTLSLTPVLCDQLEAPGAIDRCVRFLREIRPASHQLDIDEFAARGDERAVSELTRSAAQYASAAARLTGLTGLTGLTELGAGGLLGALGRHATWTSAATHAVLPLLALDDGVRLQLRTGIESHRRRFGDWGGGLWLPECAYAPWLAALLEEVGVRSACVELTGLFGLGDRRHLQPLLTDEGPVLWPIDREAIALVWGSDGYPAHPAYRAYGRLTARHHRVWSTDGSPYDRRRARDLAATHARAFVAHVSRRVLDGGICVCAVDTELLGHWWYEGVDWLNAVIAEASAQGLRLAVLDDATAQRHRPVPVPAPVELGVTSWGSGGDLRTWSGPGVADLAWLARSAELRALGSVPATALADRVLRELLALQSSDWAFLADRDWAGPYPRRRAREHADLLKRALAGEPGLDPRLRNLAPELVR